MIRVTALLFSGRPNPFWWLDGPAAARLRQRLAALPTARVVTPPPPALGYAGLRLAFEGEAEADEWHIAKGVVTGPEGEHLDADRAVERFLLAEAARQGVDLPPGLA